MNKKIKRYLLKKMLKPLIFLFLFQIIISIIFLPDTTKNNTQQNELEINEKENEIKENEKKEIGKSIDSLFANHDMNKIIKDNFQDEFVKLNENVKNIPDTYKNGLKTPHEFMMASRFNEPSEEFEVKIFKEKEKKFRICKK